LKRILSISFTSMAIAVILVMAALPHHHHGAVTCLISEMCNGHDPINEDHTEHHNAEDSGHSDSCITESQFITRSVRENNECNSSCSDDWHNHLFPVFFFYADYIVPQEENVHDAGFGEYIIYYKSIHTRGINGLRGPPSFFC